MSWWMDILRKAMGHLSEDELIDLALDGLDGPTRDRAEAHLRDCAMCRSALRRWLDLHGVLAQLAPAQAAPQGLEDRILSSIKSELRSKHEPV